MWRVHNLCMHPTRRTIVFAGPAWLVPAAIAHAQAVDAPNFAPINAWLSTSGQPPEATLRTLGRQGYQAVVYLAPSDVPNAVPGEAGILQSQGLEFVHIPIPFGAPDESHVQALFAALDRLKDRKTLVHCEINMRASVMVFLYRAIRLRESPAAAYEPVARVWSPRGVWRKLIVEQLARHKVAFEPY